MDPLELLAAVQRRLETELAARSAPPELKEPVKHTLKRSLAGKRPTTGNVARELCVSPRTLQRRLTGAGSTFQQIVEETRHELARHYLGQSAIELGETAYLLGYDDANSFFHALRAWEGTSPGQYRSALGVGGDARP